MRSSWGQPPVGQPGRAAVLEEVRAHVAGQLAKHAELQSALFCVAQYWADEADDAVHAMVVYSTRPVPEWPHRCAWGADDEEPAFGRDRCSGCGHYDYLRFDSNGSAIDLFQSCCMEGASQEHDTKDVYVPYALARRTETGVAIEIVGGPIRAWLEPERSRRLPSPLAPATRALFDLVYAAPHDEAARHVLADHLLEIGDPRGEYLTTTDPTRRAALEDRHIREWLGPIAEAAPPEHVAMERGFVRAAAVHVREPVDDLRDADAWGTVEELWFLPESRALFSDAMRSLRRVGPLDHRGVSALAACDVARSLEHLHVLLDRAGMDELARLELPRLRSLAVGAGSRNVTAPDLNLPLRRGAVAIDLELLGPLFDAPFWRRLDELVVMSTAPDVVRAWTRRAPPVPPRLTFAAPTATEAPGGFTLSVLGREAFVRMIALGPEPSLTELAAMIDALPDRVDTVRFEATRWFAPTAADRATLTQALRRPRGVV